MAMPPLKTQDDADKYLIKTFEKIINKIENAKTHKEKEQIIKEFDLQEFNAEEQLLGNKKIKEYPDYQKAKELVFDCFNWIEKEKNISIFQITHKNNFYINVQNFTIPLIAELITTIQSHSHQRVQAYLILNIFRSVYELNMKNISLILDYILKKDNKKTRRLSDYDFKNFENEFINYPKIEEIGKYFRNDLRNPIAHEEWFLENGVVIMKNKEIVKSYNLNDILSEIYELLFFRISLMDYFMRRYREFCNKKTFAPQQIQKLINSFKKKIEEIKSKNP